MKEGESTQVHKQKSEEIKMTKQAKITQLENERDEIYRGIRASRMELMGGAFGQQRNIVNMRIDRAKAKAEKIEEQLNLLNLK